MTLELNGRVLALTSSDGSISKVLLPQGDRGLQGRDGMSIRGETGEAGPKGDPGRDGRDSTVPGPQGEKGEMGSIGKLVPMRVGKVIVGDEPSASIYRVGDGNDVYDVVDFVIPRGQQGHVGRAGKDGQNGSHEFVQFMSVGNNPIWSEEFLGFHLVADGILNLPEFTLKDAGSWVRIKTFDMLVINGAMDPQFVINKGESVKLVVVPYQGKFIMTRF
jgi:hypothetical protein